jgi:hypothetical protein
VQVSEHSRNHRGDGRFAARSRATLGFQAMSTPAERLHTLLVNVDEEHGCGDLPQDVRREVPGNATRIVVLVARSLPEVTTPG